MYDVYKIRELREDHDLSQMDCVKIFNIPKNTYIRYETGQVIPPFNFMIMVADYYGVSLDYLAGRQPARQPAESLEQK